MATGITPWHDEGSTGVQPVLIHMWTLTLEGPRSLPDPLALTTIDQVTNALAPFLADLQAALSTACKAPLVLRAAD